MSRFLVSFAPTSSVVRARMSSSAGLSWARARVSTVVLKAFSLGYVVTPAGLYGAAGLGLTLGLSLALGRGLVCTLLVAIRGTLPYHRSRRTCTAYRSSLLRCRTGQ